LSESQLDSLLKLTPKLDVDNIYLIEGTDLDRTAVRVNAYYSGFYIIFVNGETFEHVTFLQYFYGENYPVKLIYLFQGVAVYGAPGIKNLTEGRQVEVTSVSDLAIQADFSY
jgi:hypothetical protein